MPVMTRSMTKLIAQEVPYVSPFSAPKYLDIIQRVRLSMEICALTNSNSTTLDIIRDLREVSDLRGFLQFHTFFSVALYKHLTYCILHLPCNYFMRSAILHILALIELGDHWLLVPPLFKI